MAQELTPLQRQKEKQQKIESGEEHQKAVAERAECACERRESVACPGGRTECAEAWGGLGEPVHLYMRI